jgi:Trk K+ transport system NAD-binding subunit
MKKENDPKKKEKPSLKKRFNYWFDNRMKKGSLGFIRILIIASVLLAVLVAGLIILLGFNEEGEKASVFWDSIATVINAWMPSFEDGSPGYIILMAVVAIAGVLFTSVLIGIITSAIEEKIDNLKRGNSLVLESDHIVVLGFYPGEYTLLRQLILAASGDPACVVIAEDMEREEMEQNIAENLDVPKNFRIVCRTADITDPASLEKCSIETCKTIIVSPTDDMRTIKAVLAASTLLAEKGVPEISVNAIISKNEYRFPPSIAEANNISTFQTNSIFAKMIAHSCTQTGLSETFREVFNFDGSEFYLTGLEGIAGMTFEELMLRIGGAVPVGLYRDGKVTLNPKADIVINEDDRILVFSEEADSAVIGPAPEEDIHDIPVAQTKDDESTGTVIIGHNETLPIILSELPENVSSVYLAGLETTEEEQEELERIASGRELSLNYIDGDPHSEKIMLKLANMAEHIVILNDHDKDPEEADMEAIFLLMNLRDIRKRFGLSFNITMEMQREHNQKLIGRGDHTDFLVASSMSSLILAQLAESPELIGVFREILSNEGNELYLKKVSKMKLEGEYSVSKLRYIMLKNGYILLGILDAEKYSKYNLPIEETVTLTGEENLIVLGVK